MRAAGGMGETERDQRRRALGAHQRRLRKERRHQRLAEVFENEMIPWSFIQRRALKI